MTVAAIEKKTRHKSEKSRLLLLIAGVIFTIILIPLYLYQPPFFRFLDNKLYDTFQTAIPQEKDNRASRPVIVDIDEKSLAEYGQWPWPRYRVALLLDRLQALGPSSVGLDTVFAEPDRTSLAVLKKDIYRDLKINVPTERVPKELLDNDRLLAAALSKGPFVLGYKFIFDETKTSHGGCLLHPLPVAVIREGGTAPNRQSSIFQARDAICNLRTLAENTASSGFINVTPDRDGVLRRVPLLIEYNGNAYPSLALATLGQSQAIKQAFLSITPGGVASLRLNQWVIPLDGKGNLLIRYRGKGRTFAYLSAADILEGAVSRDQVEGRIVFLGASASGIADFHATPFDALSPGVEIHATVIDNILNNDFFSRPSWVPGLELSMVIATGLFSAALFVRAGALWSLLILSLSAVGLRQFSFWTLQYKGIFVSPLIPFLALTGNFAWVTLLKYWREEREKKARTKEVLLTQDFTIRCLASLTECRDSETGGHILRTQAYVAAVGRQLSQNPKYADALDGEIREHLYKSSPLHDIGKVGVPDHILLKPGKLTPEEFEEMKKHTTYGRDAIQRAEDKFRTGKSSDFLRLAKEIAYTHHEKWDGTGYPNRLKGEEIPISGRIMALADVYDALISHRVYKPPFTHEESVALIIQLKGVLFDPDVIDAFVAVQEEFRQIATELADDNYIAASTGEIIRNV